MHTAEELDRSVYRVSPDDYLDERARRERKVGRWFIHFDRSCEEFEAGASVSDNAGKKAALDAESSGPGGRKHESSPPSTVVELPSGGCICRARINIAQGSKGNHGQRDVYSVTRGERLLARRISAGQRFTPKERKKESTRITRAECGI